MQSRRVREVERTYGRPSSIEESRKLLQCAVPAALHRRVEVLEKVELSLSAADQRFRFNCDERALADARMIDERNVRENFQGKVFETRKRRRCAQRTLLGCISSAQNSILPRFRVPTVGHCFNPGKCCERPNCLPRLGPRL